MSADTKGSAIPADSATPDICQVLVLTLQHRLSMLYFPLQRLWKSLWSVPFQYFLGLSSSDLLSQPLGHLSTSQSKGSVAERWSLSPAYAAWLARESQCLEGRDRTGYVACTLSHRALLYDWSRRQVVPSGQCDGSLLVLEDDVVLPPGLEDNGELPRLVKSQLELVSRVAPNWEVLLLGASCEPRRNVRCKWNRGVPVYQENGSLLLCEDESGSVHVWGSCGSMAVERGGRVAGPLKFWLGGWAYVVRDAAVAAKMVRLMTPAWSHHEFMLGQAARAGHLQVYLSLMPLVWHPGRLAFSEFGLVQNGSLKCHTTDTCRVVSDSGPAAEVKWVKSQRVPIMSLAGFLGISESLATYYWLLTHRTVGTTKKRVIIAR